MRHRSARSEDVERKVRVGRYRRLVAMFGPHREGCRPAEFVDLDRYSLGQHLWGFLRLAELVTIDDQTEFPAVDILHDAAEHRTKPAISVHANLSARHPLERADRVVIQPNVQDVSIMPRH